MKFLQGLHFESFSIQFKRKLRKLISFLLIGALAFFLDYFLFLAIEKELDFLRARIISFTVSTFFTWSLNRITTFKFQRSSDFLREGGFYYFIALLCGLLNITLSYVINGFGVVYIFSIAIGCLFSAFLNFSMLSLFVYKENV